MGDATTLLLVIAFSMANSGTAAFAAPQMYNEIVEFGEPLSIVYATNPNTIITGALFTGDDSGSIVFWATSPSGQTVAGDSSTWTGELGFSRFEFAAREGGAYTFHIQNRDPRSLGISITLTIDSRLDWNSLVLPGLVVAAVAGGVAIGWLLWRSRKRRQWPADLASRRKRPRLVRVTARTLKQRASLASPPCARVPQHKPL